MGDLSLVLDFYFFFDIFIVTDSLEVFVLIDDIFFYYFLVFRVFIIFKDIFNV